VNHGLQAPWEWEKRLRKLNLLSAAARVQTTTYGCCSILREEVMTVPYQLQGMVLVTGSFPRQLCSAVGWKERFFLERVLHVSDWPYCLRKVCTAVPKTCRQSAATLSFSPCPQSQAK